jgi:transcription elongation factor Elf1
MKLLCPVCGFPKLTEPPYSKSGHGSFEICPSCGFQFGVSDADQGFTPAQWRAAWKKRGCPWASQQTPPPDWSAPAQLRHVEKTPRQP